MEHYSSARSRDPRWRLRVLTEICENENQIGDQNFRVYFRTFNIFTSGDITSHNTLFLCFARWPLDSVHAIQGSFVRERLVADTDVLHKARNASSHTR